ncbi:MAG: hypothetical protein NUW37_18435 [Planctomycetes bacterium]|nr:hypothetical protein [Planctomycetota bacterium]
MLISEISAGEIRWNSWYQRPEGSYDTRREALIDAAAAKSGDLMRVMARVFSEQRAEDSGQPVLTSFDEDSIRVALDELRARPDCADFRACGVVRLLAQFADVMSPEFRAEVEDALSGFRYDAHDPGDDMMIFWTENHDILFCSSEYIAGSLMPDHVFSATGQTGAWHKARGRKRIEKWIDFRSRFGHAEWDSNVYFPLQLAGIINVADLAPDEELRARAARMTDVMLADMASDSFHGLLATSHGRSYPDRVQSHRGESNSNIHWLLYGTGWRGGVGNAAETFLMIAENYRPHEAVLALHDDEPEPFVSRERHSIVVEKGAELGFDPADPENTVLYWSLGATAHPLVMDQSSALINNNRLWRYAEFKPFEAALRLVDRFPAVLRNVMVNRSPAVRPYMTEVNKITWRTRNAQLSSAVDYRKGEYGLQHHLMEACLGPDALVFVTHPAAKNEALPEPNEWVGGHTFPRIVQDGPTLIAVFEIARFGLLAEPAPLEYTHAWFPRDEFDEVREQDGWVFARKDDGFIAITAKNGLSEVPDQDGHPTLRSDGKSNVWILKVGDGGQGTGDSFDEFVSSVVSTPLEYSDQGAIFGGLSASWSGIPTVEGEELTLHDFGRIDNPRVLHKYGVPRVTFFSNEGDYVLDIDSGEVNMTREDLDEDF